MLCAGKCFHRRAGALQGSQGPCRNTELRVLPAPWLPAATEHPAGPGSGGRAPLEQGCGDQGCYWRVPSNPHCQSILRPGQHSSVPDTTRNWDCTAQCPDTSRNLVVAQALALLRTTRASGMPSTACAIPLTGYQGCHHSPQEICYYGHSRNAFPHCQPHVCPMQSENQIGHIALIISGKNKATSLALHNVNCSEEILALRSGILLMLQPQIQDRECFSNNFFQRMPLEDYKETLCIIYFSNGNLLRMEPPSFFL